MTSQDIQKALAAPFSADQLDWKPQSLKGNRALAICYIDARCVQDRLDSVVGVDGWQDQYEILNDGSVMCKLRVRIGDEWVTKTDVGSPSEQPDGGDRMKAAFSDALKRAAVKFGIGRYLYSLPKQWCDFDPVKKQFVQTPQVPAQFRAAQQQPDKQPAPAQQQPTAKQEPDATEEQVWDLVEVLAGINRQAPENIVADLFRAANWTASNFTELNQKQLNQASRALRKKIAELKPGAAS